MASEEVLTKKLTEKFAPVYLSVVDESDGCGSKFTVVVVSASFDGVGLLQRQRAVNDCLAEEMKTIHALSMKTWTPAQYEKKQKKAAEAAAAAAAGADDDA